MKRTNLHLLLPSLLLAQALHGQQVALLNTYQSADPRASAACDALETRDGHIALAGWQETLQSRRQAALLLLSPHLSRKDEYLFGGGYDDAAHALAQTFDGAFVLAGYTTERGGAHKAWLFKADEAGRTLWQWKDPDPAARSEWHDVAQLPDGSLVAVGEKNGQPALIRVSESGHLLAQAVLDKTGSGAAYALALGPRGRLGIAGGAEKPGGDGQRVFFAETDTTLRAIVQRADNAPAEASRQGRSIAYDPVAKRYLLAAGGTPDAPGQVVFLTAKNAVLQIASQPPSQRYSNLAASVTALPGGSWLLAGASNNWGGRRYEFKPLLLRADTDPKTRNLGKEPVPLELADRQAKSLLRASALLHDGSLLAAGEANGRLWAFRASLPGTEWPGAVSGVSVSDERFVEAGGDDTLNAWERGYVRFTVRNAGTAPVWGLQAKVEALDNSWGLRYSRMVQLGHLPGSDTLALSIPLVGESFLASGRCTLRVTLLDARSRPLAPAFAQSFPTLEYPPPLLALSLEGIVPDSIPREQPVVVGIWVKNVGRGMACQVELSANCPYLTEAQCLTALPLDTLLPGDSVLVRFAVKVSWLYLEDAVVVRLNAYEATNYYRSQCHRGMCFRVPSFFEIKPPDSPLIRLRDIEQEMRRGGPSPPPDGMGDVWGKGDFQVLWSLTTDPESVLEKHLMDSLTGKGGSGIRPFYDNPIILRAWVLPPPGEQHDRDFYRQNLRMTWDLKEGRSSQEGDWPLYDPKTTRDTMLNGRYFFYRKTTLQPGDNAFKVTFKNPKIRFSSDYFNIRYVQPKTHWFIFGIHYDDGTHTAQNAERVGEAVQEQARLGFINTDPDGIHVWTGPDITTAKAVIDSLAKYFDQAYQYQDTNPLVGPQDRVVLYFSGHHDGNKRAFNLWFPQNSRHFTFKKQVIERLTNSPFRQAFLYLDVCNSGLVVNEMEKNLKELNEKQKQDTFRLGYLRLYDGIIPDSSSCYVFASTGRNQLALEQDTLGFWTQALAEAFFNQEVDTVDGLRCADSNADGFLSTAELDVFLRNRVSFRVKQYNQEHHLQKPHEQTPCATKIDDARAAKSPSCH